MGYIDVGDGCWRRNVFATTLRCWWRFWPILSPTSFIFHHKRRAPTSKRCHQYRKSVINTQKFLPKESQKPPIVTNIYHMYPLYLKLKLKRNISSECAEPPKFFNPDEGRSITAISSFPGSGNTWARHLLHMATGYWTANRRGSNHLKQYGWMAEDINCRDRTTLAQKTHRLHHK